MNWQIIWKWVKEILATLGLPALVATLVSIRYSNRLQRENEQLKSKLQQEMKEHEVRFSSLHAKRVGVVAKLYRRLLYVHSAYISLTSQVSYEGEPSREEKEKFLGQKWASFKNYFNLNRIWFNKDLCNEIENYMKQLDSGQETYALWRYYTGLPSHERDWPNIQQEIPELFKQIQESKKPLIDLLEEIITHFRALLGAEISSDR